MFDGITIKYLLENFEFWRRSLNLKMDITVDAFDGEIRTKTRFNKKVTTYRGKWETFDLIVKEVQYQNTGNPSYYLTVKGSLHKNQYGGANYLEFTWLQLQEQIAHLCNSLCINPSLAQISTLEVGVNVSTPFLVTPFLMSNVINYKGNCFNRYKKDPSGFCLGLVCQLTQYVVKIYDKGMQYNLPDNLLRFELRFLKMQSLNRQRIKFLSDLQNFTKVQNLEGMLLNAWNDVLIYDIPQPLKTLPLKQSEIELLIEGQNPKFWEQLKKDTTGDHFKYTRKCYKMLVGKYGNNWGTFVHDLIKNKWCNLFMSYPNLPIGHNEGLPDLTIKINGKNGECELSKEKGEEFSCIEKRFCVSCSKELHPDQKPNSKYCSSKFVGDAAAHQCRNLISNPRNNFKKKIGTLQARGLLFDIIPFLQPSFK